MTLKNGWTDWIRERDIHGGPQESLLGTKSASHKKKIRACLGVWIWELPIKAGSLSLVNPFPLPLHNQLRKIRVLSDGSICDDPQSRRIVQKPLPIFDLIIFPFQRGFWVRHRGPSQYVRLFSYKIPTNHRICPQERCRKYKERSGFSGPEARRQDLRRSGRQARCHYRPAAWDQVSPWKECWTGKGPHYLLPDRRIGEVREIRSRQEKDKCLSTRSTA